MKTLTVRLKEAENRAEQAEKSVKRLQKEVDRLEGNVFHFVIIQKIKRKFKRNRMYILSAYKNTKNKGYHGLCGHINEGLYFVGGQVLDIKQLIIRFCLPKLKL